MECPCGGHTYQRVGKKAENRLHYVECNICGWCGKHRLETPQGTITDSAEALAQWKEPYLTPEQTAEDVVDAWDF